MSLSSDQKHVFKYSFWTEYLLEEWLVNAQNHHEKLEFLLICFADGLQNKNRKLIFLYKKKLIVGLYNFEFSESHLHFAIVNRHLSALPLVHLNYLLQGNDHFLLQVTKGIASKIKVIKNNNS